MLDNKSSNGMEEERPKTSVLGKKVKDDEIRLYEIGYLLLPTLTEEGARKEADKISSLIEKSGGTQVGIGNPAIKQLAYSMQKEISRKRHIFDKAYFGWIQFRLEPENIAKIKDNLDENDQILREIIIKTTISKAPPKKPVRNISVRSRLISNEPKASEQEIDKELDVILGGEEKETSLPVDNQ